MTITVLMIDRACGGGWTRRRIEPATESTKRNRKDASKSGAADYDDDDDAVAASHRP